MVDGRWSCLWLYLIVYGLISLKTEGFNIGITYVETAVAKGAGFRLQFINAVSGLGSSTSRGLFVDSCYSHCQTRMQETWLRADSPVLGNTTIAKAVGDWYYDRSAFQKIDCPYPCNHHIYHSV